MPSLPLKDERPNGHTLSPLSPHPTITFDQVVICSQTQLLPTATVYIINEKKWHEVI